MRDRHRQQKAIMTQRPAHLTQEAHLHHSRKAHIEDQALVVAVAAVEAAGVLDMVVLAASRSAQVA